MRRWLKVLLLCEMTRLAYRALREAYCLWRCEPADEAMARRFALLGYLGNEYGFADVWADV